MIQTGDINALEQFCQQISEIPAADLNRFTNLWNPINWAISEMKMIQLDLEAFKIFFETGFKCTSHQLFDLWKKIEDDQEDRNLDIGILLFGSSSIDDSRISNKGGLLVFLFLKNMPKEELKALLQSLCNQYRKSDQRQWEQQKLIKQFSDLSTCLNDGDTEVYCRNLCEAISELSDSHILVIRESKAADKLLTVFNEYFRTKIQRQFSLAQLQTLVVSLQKLAILDWKRASQIGANCLSHFLKLGTELELLKILLVCPLNIDSEHFNLALQYCSQQVRITLIEAWSRQEIMKTLQKLPVLSDIIVFDTHISCNKRLQLEQNPLGASQDLTTIDDYTSFLLVWQERAKGLLTKLSPSSSFAECQHSFIELLKPFLFHFPPNSLEALRQKLCACNFDDMRALIEPIIRILRQASLKLAICKFGRIKNTAALSDENIEEFNRALSIIDIDHEHLILGLHADFPPDLFKLLVQRTTANRMFYVEEACAAHCNVNLLKILFWKEDLTNYSVKSLQYFVSKDVWSEDSLIERHLEYAVQHQASEDVVLFLLERMKTQHQQAKKASKDSTSLHWSYENHLREIFNRALEARASEPVLRLVLRELCQAHSSKMKQGNSQDFFFSSLLTDCINRYAPMELIKYLIGRGNDEKPEIEQFRRVLRDYSERATDYKKVLWCEQDFIELMKLMLECSLKFSTFDLRSALLAAVPLEIFLPMVSHGEISNDFLNFILMRMVNTSNSSNKKWNPHEFKEGIEALISRGSKPDFHCISNFVRTISQHDCLFYQKNRELCLEILKYLVECTSLSREQVHELTHCFGKRISVEICQAITGEKEHFEITDA